MKRLTYLLVLLAAPFAFAYAFHHDSKPVHVHAVSTSDTTPSTTSTSPPPTVKELPRTFRLRSTSYCLTTHMANGQYGYPGAVAMNGVALGTRIVVDDSPIGPGTFIVADRHAPGSTDIDFFVSDCDIARRWGRQWINARMETP